MNYIKIGYITSTHGIKGEVKVKSDFEYKEKVLNPNNSIYIGESKEELIINTHRIHKGLDMITFTKYNDINEILKYLKQDVYIKEENLALDDNEILDSDLLEYKVVSKNQTGSILEIFKASETNKIIRTLINDKEILIPYNEHFIKNINKNNKEIEVELLENMWGNHEKNNNNNLNAFPSSRL